MYKYEIDVARCPICKGPWVCWNWVVSESDNDVCHECWDCDSTFSTSSEVLDGIDYSYLKNHYPKIHRILSNIKSTEGFIYYYKNQISKTSIPSEINHWNRLIDQHNNQLEEFKEQYKKFIEEN